MKTEQELEEYGRMEAQKELSDEELERYNNLKKQKLEQDLEKKKQEDEDNMVGGLAAMRQQAEQELTVEVHGVEFLADLGPKQIHKLRTAAKFEDKQEAELTGDEYEKIRSNVLDVFADLSLNKDREDFQNHFGDAGIATLGKITEPLLEKITELNKQKKSR